VGTIRILVADDNASFRQRIKEFLASKPGMEIVGEAADGEDALRRTGELEPDVVLMDVRMPVTNGISATQQIREQMPDVKVIILSRFDLQEYREAAVDSGASGYVVKRALVDELVPAIRRSTESKRGAA
jgi:DNA-binding NarL/FixJ family response regulator